MEWNELQALWQQQDAKIAENTRINKEILKRMLRAKPEKRLNRMRGWAIYRMVMPVPVMCIALIPNVKFRNEWDFYAGCFLLIAMLAHSLYQTTKYFLLIKNIDFTNQVAKTKKQLIQLEEFRLKRMVKWTYIFFFIAMIGIGLATRISVISESFIKMTIFIILISIVTNYLYSKKFKSQMNRFNTELDEIEQLEKG